MWRDPSRVYEGSANIFLKTPGLEYLGRALRILQDTHRKYQGQFGASWRHLKDLNQEKFDAYWRENIFGDRAKAQKLYNDSNADTTTAIDLWRKQAVTTGTIARALGVKVYDPQLKGYRPMGTVHDYFPRVPKPEVEEVLRDPAHHVKEWEQLVREMLNEGIISKPEEAAPYISNVVQAYNVVGPKTSAALSKFRQAQFGKSDGLVEPGQRTIQRLLDLSGDFRLRVR